MCPTGWPETSVRPYHSTLRKIPQDHRPHSDRSVTPTITYEHISPLSEIEPRFLGRPVHIVVTLASIVPQQLERTKVPDLVKPYAPAVTMIYFCFT